MSYLAHELLVVGDVQTAVKGAALQLVQQDVLAAQQGGALALPGVAQQGGGRALGCGGAAEGGAEGRGESAGGYHSLVYGDLAQGLGPGQGHGGHHALPRARQLGGRGQCQLQRLDPPWQYGLDGGVGRQRGQAGGVGEHHTD